MIRPGLLEKPGRPPLQIISRVKKVCLPLCRITGVIAIKHDELFAKHREHRSSIIVDEPRMILEITSLSFVISSFGELLEACAKLQAGISNETISASDVMFFIGLSFNLLGMKSLLQTTRHAVQKKQKLLRRETPKA
ncbi:MAG: hypothetical protein ACREOI_22885, partial [bacterium]